MVIGRLLNNPNKCHSETRSLFERGEESAFSLPPVKSGFLALLGMTTHFMFHAETR
jgi:hypothetical protein